MRSYVNTVLQRNVWLESKWIAVMGYRRMSSEISIGLTLERGKSRLLFGQQLNDRFQLGGQYYLLLSAMRTIPKAAQESRRCH